MIRILLFLVAIPFAGFLHGQSVFKTFSDTKVINSYSVETLEKRKLDVRIGHRFGDIAGPNGGWRTFYGLEQAEDVLIGVDYGISNRVMIGLSRTKGSGPLRQNINGFVKAKFLEQTQGIPVTFTAVSLVSISTMQKSNNPNSLSFFETFDQRMVYHNEIMVARKFSERFSFQLSFASTYRNLVDLNDQNNLLSLGGALRYKFTKGMAFILEGRQIFSDIRNSESGYYSPLGVGLEFNTNGGHVFQINLTNASGIMETDYIPYSQNNWSDGEYRLGFTISRLFNL